MPTHGEEESFWRDYAHLSAEQRAAFGAAVAKLNVDLKTGRFRKGLRVKRLERSPDVWEMTWAANGRALFSYGPPKRPGQQHIVWLRIGTHDILNDR